MREATRLPAGASASLVSKASVGVGAGSGQGHLEVGLAGCHATIEDLVGDAGGSCGVCLTVAVVRVLVHGVEEARAYVTAGSLAEYICKLNIRYLFVCLFLVGVIIVFRLFVLVQKFSEVKKKKEMGG